MVLLTIICGNYFLSVITVTSTNHFFLGVIRRDSSPRLASRFCRVMIRSRIQRISPRSRGKKLAMRSHNFR